MTSFEENLSTAIASGTVPGGVFLAADKSGKFKYSHAIGVRSSNPDRTASEPLTSDTVLTVASCTKLFTGIAAVQCVEKGLLKLDADVAVPGLLPELANLEILEGWDEEKDQPITRPRSNTITLRTLLSHSSGLAYELIQPLLLRWRQHQGGIPWSGKTVPERYTYPLMFEPGTSWMYGAGSEWTGKLIERVTNSTLEEYMKSHIWDPLQLTSATFWPSKNPSLANRMAEVGMLSETGKAVPLAGFDLINGLEDCNAGAGMHISADDLLVALQAVLHRDPRLLKQESWEELCADQLSNESRAALEKIMREDDVMNINCGMNVPQEGRKSWSLGGLLSLDEYKGWMGKNTLLWGGMTNIDWFVDHDRGLCGLGATQVMTFGKPHIHDLLGEYSRHVYKLYQEAGGF